MKFNDILRGHIPANEEQRKEIWKQADFVFDTNVLLDVYRYTDASRAGFFKLLTALKGRVFVPNRVAVEFARNRQVVIRSHFRPQQLIKNKLNEAAKEIEEKHPKHPLRDDLRKLIESAKSLDDQQFGKAEKKHNALISDDSILRELLSIIGEDVGDPCPQEEVSKEYKRRKDGSIPPYCKIDDDKDEVQRNGDVVIWLEVLKKYEGTGKPVIFVTGDTKENWWQDSGGGRSDAQPFLVQEMYERSKADVLFYSSERFSERAPTYLGIEVPKGLAEETKEIRQQEKAIHIISTTTYPAFSRETITSKRRRARGMLSPDVSANVIVKELVQRLESLRRTQSEIAIEQSSLLRQMYEEKALQEARSSAIETPSLCEDRPVTIETVKKQEEPPDGH